MDNSVTWGYINAIYKRLSPATSVNWMRGDHDAQVSPVQSTSFPAHTQVWSLSCVPRVYQHH